MSGIRRSVEEDFGSKKGHKGLKWTGGIIGVMFLLWLVIFVISLISARSTPQAGEIGVVRSGTDAIWAPTWFNGFNIRGIVPNGAGSTFTGLGSDTHFYPVSTQQRFFRMQTCYAKNDPRHLNPLVCPGADGLAVKVPTSDGVEVTISGTFYLNTAFNNTPKGERVLKDFDTQFSTRTFGGLHPYDGNQGWENFLSAMIEPIIQNNMRQTVSSITCAQLVSSCALVQNTGNTAVLVKSQNNAANVQSIEDQINAHFESDLKATLGEDYFQNVQFRIGTVELPVAIQQAIDSAQAAFAGVSKAQANKARAKLDSQANEIRQAGYNACPTCAAIDQIKAIPNNITVWAPGSNSSISLPSSK